VTVPFKWYPGERVLTQAFLWRLLDLEEADGRRVDLVVATKFPSYCVRHPRKVVWLLHQFRQAYDLDRTALGQFSESPADRATLRAVQRLDRICLGEARRVFATSRNVAERLGPSTGIAAAGVPPPAAGAAVPVRGVRGLRALRRPARSREADRPPARGPGRRAHAASRGRRRGLGPGAPGEVLARERAERPCHLRRQDQPGS